MRKMCVVLALCVAAACACADPVTDALRTFFAKGGCVDFEISIDAKEKVSGTFSIVMSKSILEAEGIMARVKGTFDGKTGDLLMVGSEVINMKYIKSITNDADGNLVVVSEPLTAADLANDDMGGFLEALLDNILN